MASIDLDYSSITPVHFSDTGEGDASLRNRAIRHHEIRIKKPISMSTNAEGSMDATGIDESLPKTARIRRHLLAMQNSATWRQPAVRALITPGIDAVAAGDQYIDARRLIWGDDSPLPVHP